MDNTKHTTYPLLIPSSGADGAARQVGLEVEFAGLDEKTAADIIAAVTKGSVRQDNDVWIVDTDVFGACEVYLDTKYKSELTALGDTALDVARQVVPVEWVTEPFDPVHLPLFDAVLAALRNAGAKGSRASPIYGFGMHLNVEIATPHVDHVLHIAQSYALLEPLIREASDLDLSRRLLPFIDPYPAELVTALASARPTSAEHLVAIVLQHSTSRNHGLDLLPVLAWLNGEKTLEYLDDDTKNAPRPAYHFRLPESRIDEADWTVHGDWNIWIALERVAQDDALRGDLCAAWLEGSGQSAPKDWTATASDILRQHNHKEVLI